MLSNGSVRVMINANGNDNCFPDYNPFRQDRDAGGTGNDYKFTGNEWDAESGLHYFWHRFYDPEIGRFVQVDPMWIKFPNMTSYHYCVNNPTIYTDFAGLDTHYCDINLDHWIYVYGKWSGNKGESIDGTESNSNGGYSGVSGSWANQGQVSMSNHTERINVREMQISQQEKLLKLDPSLARYGLQQQMVATSIVIQMASGVYILPANSALVDILLARGGKIVTVSTTFVTNIALRSKVFYNSNANYINDIGLSYLTRYGIEYLPSTFTGKAIHIGIGYYDAYIKK